MPHDSAYSFQFNDPPLLTLRAAPPVEVSEAPIDALLTASAIVTLVVAIMVTRRRFAR